MEHMKELLTAFEEILDRKLEEKLEEVLEHKFEEKLEQILERKFEEKLEEVLDRKLDEKLQPIYEERMDRLEERMDRLEERMDILEDRVLHIEVILENEIRPNIQTIAEGHSDLNRKFDEVQRMSNKWEMTALKVNYHDALLRELNNSRKTSCIAEEKKWD